MSKRTTYSQIHLSQLDGAAAHPSMHYCPNCHGLFENHTLLTNIRCPSCLGGGVVAPMIVFWGIEEAEAWIAKQKEERMGGTHAL